MTNRQSRRTTMAALGAAGAVTALLMMAGCTNKASQGVPPPTPEQLKVGIQNNPHIPPQARAAAARSGGPGR